MKVIFITTVFADCVSSENIGLTIHSTKHLYFVVANGDESPSTSQIVEQIEFIKEILLPGLLKLNDSAKNKEQGDQTRFSPYKNIEKENGFSISDYYICYLFITPIN